MRDGVSEGGEKGFSFVFFLHGLGVKMGLLRHWYVLVLGLSLSAWASGPTMVPLLSISDRMDGLWATEPLAQPDLIKTISFNNWVWKDLQSGQYQLSSPESTPVALLGQPVLPQIIERVKIPSGFRAEVRLIPVSLEQTEGAIEMLESPPVLVWDSGRLEDFKQGPSFGQFFPGKWSEDSLVENELVIRIFPAQWDRYQHKLMLLREARLEVKYYAADMPAVASGSAAVIVTSSQYEGIAKKLQAFHATQYGVHSEILYGDQLDKMNAPLIDEADLPSGYKKMTDAADHVTPWDKATQKGYNYDRARRLAHHLQSRTKAKDGLRYVILLGDTVSVPPSYYFSISNGLNDVIGVTDQCYGAVGLCLEPRVAVGRLPLTTEAELDVVLSKALVFQKKAGSASRELALQGGKAFRTEVYIGELGALRTLGIKNPTWHAVLKEFRTLKNYDAKGVLNTLLGLDDTALVYSVDHGSGNGLAVERQLISAKQILTAPKVNALPPVVASIACTNAAFDQAIVPEPLFDNVAKYGDVSVGEALLKAPMGAAAYLGSARPAMGAPVYSVDKQGNLDLTGSTQGLRVLDGFFEKYHEIPGKRLGDYLLETTQAYMANEKVSDTDILANYTFLNTELLGDPLLPMPERTQLDEAKGLAKSEANFDGTGWMNLPFLTLDGNAKNVEFSTSAKVRAMVIQQTKSPVGGGMSETHLEDRVIENAGSDRFLLDAQTSTDPLGTYFVRLENKDGVPVERQVWFRVQDAVTEMLALGESAFRD